MQNKLWFHIFERHKKSSNVTNIMESSTTCYYA